MSGRPAALVTGASNGIGASFVRLLGGAGYDLVMVARGAPALDRVAEEIRDQHHVAVEVIAADLADGQQLAVTEARAASVDHPIELLVNNAGVGSAGAFIDLPIDGEVGQVDLNVTALIRLTHAVLPGMVGRGGGGIINVSSLGAFQPAPLNATYSATKAFVLSFTEAVHEEVLASGVRVTCLCPGFTHTGFQDRSGMSAPGIPEFAWQTSDQVAESGWAGWQQNRAVVVPGALNKATAGMVRMLPRVAVRKMAKRVAGML